MTEQQKAFLKKHGIEVTFNFGANPSINIKNSHLVNRKSRREHLLSYIHQLDEYKALVAVGYKRTRQSQLNEWSAHNVLYEHGYKPGQTAHASIDQNESIWRRIGYAILSIFAE